MTNCRSILLCLLVLLMIPALAFATQGTGIGHVGVGLNRPPHGLVAKSVTDRAGACSFKSLEAGDYTVTLDSSALKQAAVLHISVTGGRAPAADSAPIAPGKSDQPRSSMRTDRS